jgi:predicted amidophosphoribosyltransferase
MSNKRIERCPRCWRAFQFNGFVHCPPCLKDQTVIDRKRAAADAREDARRLAVALATRSNEPLI